MKKIQIKKDNEVFSRFEFKYMIKKNISEAIQNEVKNFTKEDNFLDKKNKYLVRSLYFDNNLFSNFNEKIDGIKNRHKFRIRTYIDHEDLLTPLFLDKVDEIRMELHGTVEQLENCFSYQPFKIIPKGGYDFWLIK